MNNFIHTPTMEIFVDFDDCDEKHEEKKEHLYDKNYDFKTIHTYRQLREAKANVLMTNDFHLEENEMFSFPYQWDPYTGERLGLDPHGPLYFNPLELANHFYFRRMMGLWVDDPGYSGYYGDNVGAGENVMIPSRGDYRETYLFRLPISDCYLEEGHDMSIITMGPKLNNDEIKQLDKLCAAYCNKYCFNKQYSLLDIKEYYDIAIDPEPKEQLDKQMKTFEGKGYELKHMYVLVNQWAVDKLKLM